MKAPGTPPWRILVVGAEPLVCNSITWLLTADGHQTETAGSGEAALALFKRGSFDVVILDYTMPGTNADEAAAAIKSLDPHRPILVLTACPETVASLSKPLAGGDLFLPRPFSLSEFREAVTNIICKRQSLPSKPRAVNSACEPPHPWLNDSFLQTYMKTPSTPKWRILVVDDDPLVCDSIKWILSLDGHQVATALTGQSGIHQFQTARFDAVILDYKLPDMNGDQVAAAIKSLGPDQPILIVTAYPETVASLGKLLTGEYLVIPKPFSVDELRKAVTNIISKRQSLPPATAPSAASRPSRTPPRMP